MLCETRILELGLVVFLIGVFIIFRVVHLCYFLALTTIVALLRLLGSRTILLGPWLDIDEFGAGLRLGVAMFAIRIVARVGRTFRHDS
jgi:hypothetical protein